MENSFDCSALFNELDLRGQLSRAKNTNLYLGIILVAALAGIAFCYFQMTTLNNENKNLMAKIKRLENQ